jgi:hypothetical protein
MAIALSVLLQITDSNYLFDIFKLFSRHVTLNTDQVKLTKNSYFGNLFTVRFITGFRFIQGFFRQDWPYLTLQLYVRGKIVPTYWKHLHYRIISLRATMWTRNVNVTPPLFIGVLAPRKENGRSCICVLWISNLLPFLWCFYWLLELFYDMGISIQRKPPTCRKSLTNFIK